MATDFACDPPNISSRRSQSPSRAQLAPVQIRAHEKITFVGDSLTSGFNGALSWPTGTGNFIDQVNATLGAGNEIVATENGVPSIGIDYLSAHISTMVFASDPTLVFLWIGTNDAAGAGVENFREKYITYLSNIIAWKPTIKLVTIGLGPRGSEYWELNGSGNPVWSPLAPSLYTYDSDIQLASAALGATFIDWRKWLLAWEVVHNPGAGTSGFATIDGTHYNDTGQKQIAACALQSRYLSVFP